MYRVFQKCPLGTRYTNAIYCFEPGSHEPYKDELNRLPSKLGNGRVSNVFDSMKRRFLTKLLSSFESSWLFLLLLWHLAIPVHRESTKSFLLDIHTGIRILERYSRVCRTTVCGPVMPRQDWRRVLAIHDAVSVNYFKLIRGSWLTCLIGSLHCWW
jgi:hypothetical protein